MSIPDVAFEPPGILHVSSVVRMVATFAEVTTFTPLMRPCPVIFFRGNGRWPDQSHFLKAVSEGALYSTFPPQYRIIRFAPRLPSASLRFSNSRKWMQELGGSAVLTEQTQE